jgi:hypothetical protein
MRAVLAIPRDRIPPLVALSVVFLATVAVSAFLIRLLAGASVGFDSAASVIHFERIIGGRQLEAFVTTTPKPALTLVFGVLHAVGGWFAVAAATVLVFAAGVTLAAWLAWRVGGPVAAGFAAVAIVGSPLMLLDVGKAYAVAWALLPWLIAAWAVLAPNPRYWLAAFALLVAALIRIETLVVVPGALLAIVLARIAHRADPSVVPRAALAIVFVPMLAIPVMAAHDWLLTGDPLFWVQVSTRFAEAASVRRRPRIPLAGRARGLPPMAGSPVAVARRPAGLRVRDPGIPVPARGTRPVRLAALPRPNRSRARVVGRDRPRRVAPRWRPTGWRLAAAGRARLAGPARRRRPGGSRAQSPVRAVRRQHP